MSGMLDSLMKNTAEMDGHHLGVILFTPERYRDFVNGLTVTELASQPAAEFSTCRFKGIPVLVLPTEQIHVRAKIYAEQGWEVLIYA